MAVGDLYTDVGTGAYRFAYTNYGSATTGTFFNVAREEPEEQYAKKPPSLPFSVQWRMKDKSMPNVVNRHLHRGNGWVEMVTHATLELAERVIKDFAQTYPKVEWRIEHYP